METTFCLTVTMFFINGISNAEKTSYQFEKHANLRLESTFDRSEAKSAIVCCGICKITSDCLSVCYNKVTKECLMSKVSGCFVTDNSQPDDAWHVYTETEPPKSVPGPGINIATEYKIISQSSESHNYRPATNAVDGNLGTISHTDHETTTWWTMEFCNSVTIGRLVVWNRRDCCASQLSDIDITVDDVFCGTITGIVAKGASVEILCPEPLIGTLLKLQKTTYGPLNLAEVQIYSA